MKQSWLMWPDKRQLLSALPQRNEPKSKEGRNISLKAACSVPRRIYFWWRMEVKSTGKWWACGCLQFGGTSLGAKACIMAHFAPASSDNRLLWESAEIPYLRHTKSTQRAVKPILWHPACIKRKLCAKNFILPGNGWNKGLYLHLLGSLLCPSKPCFRQRKKI